MTILNKRHCLTIVVALVAFAYSSFFLQGLRLFDNDYNQWLTYAREYSFPAILWQIFDPILTEWNVDFRPFQTLTFKLLYSLFDYNAPGYYYFKSAMAALFCVGYFSFLCRYLNNQIVALLSALFLAMASSTFTSLYWVSDFVIVSEFWALLVFVIFLHLETKEQTDRKEVIFCLFLMVLLTLICDRTKANGKLIPGILFLYIVLFDWRKLKRYGLSIALMVVMLLPWPVLLSDPAPFIFAKTGSLPDYSWQPASVEKFWKLFGSDFMPLSLFYSDFPPISVLAILGFPLVYFGIIATAIIICRPSVANVTVRFLIVWTTVNIIALMSYPTLPPYFQSRYAISVLVPLLPLVLLSVHTAVDRIWTHSNIPKVLLSILVVTQLIFHSYHTARMRNSGMPGFMIASDVVREYITSNYSDSVFYYYNMPVYAYKPTTDGNQFFSSQNVSLSKVISFLPQGTPLFIICRSPLQEGAMFKRRAIFPGRSDNFFDNVFHPSNDNLPVTLYLYQIL